MTILRHPSLPEVEPKVWPTGFRFRVIIYPARCDQPVVEGPEGKDEQDAIKKWNDWVRPLVELQAQHDRWLQLSKDYGERIESLEDDVSAVNAERDRLEADLAAANARADDLMGHIQLSASTHPKECSCHLCDLVALNDQPEQPT